MRERYLGLHLPYEDGGAACAARLARLGELVAGSLDLDEVLRIAGTARVPAQRAAPPAAAPSSPGGGEAGGAGSEAPGGEARVRIAVARDAAFCFYYHE
jgi:cobyrinic acid a,c-diamide synthase